MTKKLSFLDRSSALARLRELARADALPQSLLLVGPEGSGKIASAIELAVELLRPSARTPAAAPAAGASLFGDLEPEPPKPAANVEAAASKARRLAHPDLMVSFPVESSLKRDTYLELIEALAKEPLARVRQPGSAIIPIGDSDDPGPVSVRAIRRFVGAVPFEAAHRVVIVGDAHRMNRQAANALLKTLEEPPPRAVLLLCTHQPHLLPATVRSRCARVPVPGFSESDLADYLCETHRVKAEDAAQIAAVASGNARRAFDLLDPHARVLAGWARTLLEALLRGDRVQLARGAERVGKGQAPVGKSGKLGGDASLSANRDVGMRVLDAIVADLVALGRLGSGARLDPARTRSLPDTPEARAVDVARASEAADHLLRARNDLARNVNVGLVLVHGLLEAEHALAGRASASTSD